MMHQGSLEPAAIRFTLALDYNLLVITISHASFFSRPISKLHKLSFSSQFPASMFINSENTVGVIQ